MKRQRMIALATVGMLALACCGAAVAKPARIAWDDAGVPHIAAQTDVAGFRAFGWAQMEAHGDMILDLYGHARGRAAEYWGEKDADSDRMTRTLGLPGLAKDWLRTLPSGDRARLDAFVAGMNAYARAHPDQIAPDRRIVLPIRSVDTLAYIEQAINMVYAGGNAIRAAQQTSLKTSRAEDSHDHGSNGYAIAPAKSADGHAMLLINPHLRWQSPFIWFETQLKMPSFDIYGAANVGMPTIGIGFNEFGGWTHTVNTADDADLYRLRVQGDGYWYDGVLRPFETRSETYKVKHADGTLEARTLAIRQSVQGPVIRQDGDTAIALRLSTLRPFGMLGQYWAMAAARNLDQFEAAMRRMQIASFNTIYANREGHIYYYYGAQIPDRKTGDSAFWGGIVPGDSSRYLWSGTLPYDAAPRLTDPPSGFLQNANDPPWFVTYPRQLDPTNFPPSLAPRAKLAWRPQHALRQLLVPGRIGFDDLVGMAESDRLELADRITDALLTAIAGDRDPLMIKATSVLRDWDHTTDRDSKGSILFIRWADAMRDRFGDTMFATPWSADHPLTTPDGLADPAAAAAMLRTTAIQLQQRYGRIDLAYGDVVHLRLGTKDVPASGGPQIDGSFRATLTRREPDDSETVVGGNGFFAVVSFGTRLKAVGLLPYGNSSQPGSPLIGNQLEAFAQKTMRPILFYDEDLRGHVTRYERIGQ